MSVCSAIISLEEIRQQLLSDALDQVQRLQDPSVALTWLAIVDAAMGICEWDHAIRLLQGMATGTDEQHFIYQSQPILTKPIPTKPHRTHPSLILPTTIKPKPSQ